MMFEPDENVIDGTPTAAGTYNFTLELGGTSPATTLPFSGNVIASSGNCVIGPVTAPPATSGEDYGVTLFASAPCTSPSTDNPALYSWSISGNANTGLGLAPADQHTSANELFGKVTTPSGGTDVITITFTNANTSPSTAAMVTYTIPIQ
jgi:hypothetical protein